MSLSERDIKLLWGRAASRCAICKEKLTQDKVTAKASFPLGEQAHIVGEKPTAPRGQSNLAVDNRNSYFNLVLLCPTHHTLIDNNPEDYPVEYLHILKSQHELWVEETLSTVQDMRKQAVALVYSTLIDATVEHLQLEDWDQWISSVLRQPPVINQNMPNNAFKYRKVVLSAVWPGTYSELERSIETLSLAYITLINCIMLHVDLEDNAYKGVRFYKLDHYNEELYKKLSKEYSEWLQNCLVLVYEVVKALNWFSDIVRRDINPLFFAIKGRFAIEQGVNLGFSIRVPAYSDDEKETRPGSLLEFVEKLEEGFA